MRPQTWSSAVREVKQRLEALAGDGVSFNSCLLNLYRDGRDNMGWHSDSEPLYGKEPLIGSASFGAPRDFMLRWNEDHAAKLRYSLGALPPPPRPRLSSAAPPPPFRRRTRASQPQLKAAEGTPGGMDAMPRTWVGRFRQVCAAS